MAARDGEGFTQPKRSQWLWKGVLAVEVVLEGRTALVMEETSVVEVALVAAMVVVDMVAVGMAIIELVTMEAVLEVAEATMTLAITTIFKFCTQERKLWRPELWALW